MNTRHKNTTYGHLYKRAAKSDFVPEDIMGENICYEVGPSFHRHVLPPMDAECSNCHARMWFTEKIKASPISERKYGLCCNSGKIKIPLPLPPPQELLAMITDHTGAVGSPSADLHQFIRAYNTLFAFASMVNSKINEPTPTTSYNPENATAPNPSYCINGTIYHKVGSLRLNGNATNENTKKFTQVYFSDPDEQLTSRTSLIAHLKPDTIQMLQRMVHRDNPYARRFMTIYEEYGDQPFGHLRVKITAAQTQGRRYDCQTYPEIAALVVEDSVDGSYSAHDIIIRDRSDGQQLISSLHASYIPLHYVLMFPFGDDGWFLGMQSNVPDQVIITLRAYCAYMLMVRPNYYIHHYGKLFQQYIVDNYVRIESARVQYYRLNQQQLRAELYSGITDNADPRQIGRSIVLPSSFQGGPRFMRQMLQDGLAIIRQKGKPSLFITMTCNPKWPEIVDAMAPGQTAYDRPDITSRVFHMKAKDLIDDVVGGNCFGKVTGYIATVEFQKRGLPHLHMILVLDTQDRPHTPADFDKFISCELPDPNSHPQLYDTVTKSMMHAPCGPKCLVDGICKDGYPKPFNSVTRLNSDGYPVYKRPNNGRTHYLSKGNCYGDNRHVIPYNKYLSQRYNSHINVEISTSSRAVKYLCKYITKGSDRARLEIQGDDGSSEVENEIDNFLNSRYIGPCEAVWRTFGYSIHYHYPSVMRLDIHLPDAQMVTFTSSMSPEELQAARESSARSSKLLAFFHLCDVDEQARTYTYPEIPTRFTWDRRSRQWMPRTNPPTQNIVTRIYTASLSNMELYSLRLLLLSVRGPKCFDDLKLYDGEVCETFQESARCRGLLESDDEWDRCLQEAAEMAPYASMIRRLFSYILVNCSPADPCQLWLNHRDSMSADYFYELRRNNNLRTIDELTENQIDQTYKRSLGDIDLHLQSTGYSLSDFTSMPQETITDLDVQPRFERLLIREQRSYDSTNESMFLASNLACLNIEQDYAYKKITAAIDNTEASPDTPKLFFVNGAGGTGKTLLFKMLLAYTRSLDKIALPVASSGIAAIILPGGRTAHSRFKIPINADTYTTCNLPLGSAHARLISKSSLILWDEAVMCSKVNMEAVDRSLRDIMGASDSRLEHVPFGGKVVVFGGDFRQILPVVKRGLPCDIIADCIKSASFWSQVELLKLNINMRLRLSSGESSSLLADFANTIVAIGDGRSPYTDTVNLANDWVLDSTNVNQLISKVYPFLGSDDVNVMEYKHRTILCTTNANVDIINSIAFNIFPGESRHYTSTDKITDGSNSESDSVNYPVEYLRTLNPSGMPSHTIALKIGMPLILLRNLDPENGLCNGTRLYVVSMHARHIVVKTFSNNTQHIIPRIYAVTNEDDYPFKLRRTQLPVRPAFGMTIHKSQGQTLNHVGIYLNDPVFSHGQLYVAISRVTNPSNLTIAVPFLTDVTLQHTQNIVYREILLSD